MHTPTASQADWLAAALSEMVTAAQSATLSAVVVVAEQDSTPPDGLLLVTVICLPARVGNGLFVGPLVKEHVGEDFNDLSDVNVRVT